MIHQRSQQFAILSIILLNYLFDGVRRRISEISDWDHQAAPDEDLRNFTADDLLLDKRIRHPQRFLAVLSK